jgi:hypothetical protein
MSRRKFVILQAKLAKCLVEWDDNHKSQAAKEVLIKSIAQSIPVYVISVLTKMIRRYCWGAENGKRKTHSMAWDIMVKPNRMGVLASGTCIYLIKHCWPAKRGD